jgi:hypothetical protein
MKLWLLVRPWLGLGTFLYEMVQPLFGRPVEPLIVGGAVAMMGLEALSRASKAMKNGQPS